MKHTHNLSELLIDLQSARNAALVVGAGVSAGLGIPLGYEMPIKFGQTHQALLNNLGLRKVWETAAATTQWPQQHSFVSALVEKFDKSIELQETLLSWLMGYPAMQGKASDLHAILALSWLSQVFHHLITTNWDFLLETQLDMVYEQAYTGDPFQPVEVQLLTGQSILLKAEHLFFQEHLDGDDYAWNPRWDVVANQRDLIAIQRWTRPLWKIHGSPFFLACPQCSGINRWKRQEDLHVGDPCPEHAHEHLTAEISFWGQGIDTAYPAVWNRLKARLRRCDLIVVSGLSGTGSDAYIRLAIEKHPNAWLVNPTEGAWNVHQMHFVEAGVQELTAALLEHFPS